MMKCKYCGVNLTLEQAYCPHCGRPNEEAAQHVKDMEHYKSNFEDTKSDVYEVAEKNTEIMSHMIIITVLVILCVGVFIAVIIVMKNISCSWKPAERIVTFMKV